MKEKDISLIRKYNVPGPRYTSYPTVPYWDNSSFSKEKWNSLIKAEFNSIEELSLYIHLPYCESLCTFCGCNTRITVNHSVEESYIDALLKEWILYLQLMKFKPEVKEIHLGGGTPTFFSPENLKRLITGITRSVYVAEDAEFGFEGHPNNTTREHLQVLYDLGFRRVSFGIQDFDSKVQEAINRIQTFESVKTVTEIAREIGYTSVNYDLVYGLPFQRIENIETTISNVNLLKPDRIAFYSYAHVPWLKPGQRKFTELDLPDDEVKRALYEKGRGLLEEAGYKEIGMDHFALPEDALHLAANNKSLHRNFMGYTISHTTKLIGLGVSSISDLGVAYAQNVKTVEEYKELLAKDYLPVFRGHFLNEEDRIIREHILNIMCRQETSWFNPGLQCEALYSGIERMGELLKDGLIECSQFTLKVTEKGMPFIRNIGMALDARLHRGMRAAQFSKVV